MKNTFIALFVLALFVLSIVHGNAVDRATLASPVLASVCDVNNACTLLPASELAR